MLDGVAQHLHRVAAAAEPSCCVQRLTDGAERAPTPREGQCLHDERLRGALVAECVVDVGSHHEVFDPGGADPDQAFGAAHGLLPIVERAAVLSLGGAQSHALKQ